MQTEGKGGTICRAPEWFHFTLRALGEVAGDEMKPPTSGLMPPALLLLLLQKMLVLCYPYCMLLPGAGHRFPPPCMSSCASIKALGLLQQENVVLWPSATPQGDDKRFNYRAVVLPGIPALGVFKGRLDGVLRDVV